MNKIFVTGDVHGGHDKGKIFNFYQNMKGKIDPSDVMIIAGDWGYIWSQNPMNHNECEDKNKLSSKMTYFVVLGNHENYDRIDKLPQKTQFGNIVRYEPEFPNIFYAINGNVYDICGKKFWCMGGGFSIDKQWRKPGISWWHQEVPTDAELDAIYKNFVEYVRQELPLDYIITHTCPLDLQPFDKFLSFDADIEINKSLETMLQKVWDALPDHKPEWYCGHFHIDEFRQIKFLYQNIVRLV